MPSGNWISLALRLMPLWNKRNVFLALVNLVPSLLWLVIYKLYIKNSSPCYGTMIWITWNQYCCQKWKLGQYWLVIPGIWSFCIRNFFLQRWSLWYLMRELSLYISKVVFTPRILSHPPWYILIRNLPWEIRRFTL